MNPYGFLVVKQGSKCGESNSPRDCEKCLSRWFSRLMGALSRAEGGKNKGGSGRSRGSGIKSHNGKREGPYSSVFFFLGGKTLSKFGEGKEQSVEKIEWQLFHWVPSPTAKEI
uniref:Uncharacterized protein n=1 Tax=Vitis vinifera TaxID=29760 RepID=F6I1J9_VITVI